MKNTKLRNITKLQDYKEMPVIRHMSIILQHYKHYKKVCEMIDLEYKKNYKITRITTFMTKISSTNICLQSSLEKLQYYLQPPCNYKILGG